jgi:hypothetical protein
MQLFHHTNTGGFMESWSAVRATLIVCRVYLNSSFICHNWKAGKAQTRRNDGKMNPDADWSEKRARRRYREEEAKIIRRVVSTLAATQ